MGSVDNRSYDEISPFLRFMDLIFNSFRKSAVWFRENIVKPNQKEYYWYHEVLPRVPTIDECYTDDHVCMYEANEQYLRDKRVDEVILKILRRRYVNCKNTSVYDKEQCKPLLETFDKATTNFFIKYGDMGMRTSAMNCYMKQKNRMAWERRHGPVGSGRKVPE